jgi:hypothetical protein
MGKRTEDRLNKQREEKYQAIMRSVPNNKENKSHSNNVHERLYASSRKNFMNAKLTE